MHADQSIIGMRPVLGTGPDILVDQAIEFIQIWPGCCRLGLDKYFMEYGPGGTWPYIALGA